MQMYFWVLKIYVSEALAQYNYVHIFVGTFGGLAPPPQYQKAGYATDYKRLTKQWRSQGAMGAVAPPKIWVAFFFRRRKKGKRKEKKENVSLKLSLGKEWKKKKSRELVYAST